MNASVLSIIPQELQWENPPVSWNVEGEALTIEAGTLTDLFTSPAGSAPKNNSPRALFAPGGNVLLSAKVDVDFKSKFDAGVLIVYNDKTRWAKLCFEYSPQQQPMVVSVVTNGISDDCNSVVIDGHQVYLRIALIEQAIAFHFSMDGKFWHMVRFFTLGELDNLRIGFSSQSPAGEGCTAKFSNISYEKKTLKDNRSGE